MHLQSHHGKRTLGQRNYTTQVAGGASMLRRVHFLLPPAWAEEIIVSPLYLHVCLILLAEHVCLCMGVGMTYWPSFNMYVGLDIQSVGRQVDRRMLLNILSPVLVVNNQPFQPLRVSMLLSQRERLNFLSDNQTCLYILMTEESNFFPSIFPFQTINSISHYSNHVTIFWCCSNHSISKCNLRVISDCLPILVLTRDQPRFCWISTLDSKRADLADS